MGSLPIEALVEKELDLLRKDLETMRTGASYVEKSAAILRLADEALRSFHVTANSAMEKISKTSEKVEQGSQSASASASKLSSLLQEFDGIGIRGLLEAQATLLIQLHSESRTTKELVNEQTIKVNALEGIIGEKYQKMNRYLLIGFSINFIITLTILVKLIRQ